MPHSPNVGTGTKYWKRELAVFAPAGLVTMTLTDAPAVPAGVVAVIVVSSTTLTAAADPPIVTLVAPVKLAPLILTVVPPVGGPLLGFTEVTVGGCGSNNVEGPATDALFTVPA